MRPGHWAATRAVELTDAVAVHAGDLAGRYSLRGADAVHLASLLAIGADGTLFAVWDERLRAGAATAGVHLVPQVPESLAAESGSPTVVLVSGYQSAEGRRP